ncbi:MAG: D-alanyl-D-alanine carboxypeptidase/D-alanyl-D-alanine endopeptidase [Longimicrobiales bacterium]
MNRFILLLVVVGACAPRQSDTPQPRRPRFLAVADSLVHFSDLNSAHWGIEVFDQARNQSLFSFNASRHFIPASNTKVVVTSVAMGMLGPEYRYRTELLGTPQGDDGRVERVVVVGRGDPTWSDRFYPSHLTVPEQLADSLWQQGLRAVTGELVIDASFFGDERVNGTWEVGDLPYETGAASGAFVLGEGVIELEVTPGAQPGQAASLRVLGPQGLFPIRSSINTDTTRSGANVDVEFHTFPDSVVLTGRIGSRGPDTTSIAAPDPVRYAAAVFADALTRKGIQVARVRVVYDSTEAASLRGSAARPLTSWTSEPLAKIIAGLLQPSQNWIAEQLVRTLGGLQKGIGTWSAGLDVERRFTIDVIQLDSTSFQLRDASGLSAQNLLSPQALVRLLEYDRQATWAAQYRAALPTPGMRNSTLSNRLEGLEGKVFAKTGTITNVATLSGYVMTQSGRELTFSIMVNASGKSSAQVRRGIDRLVAVLAEERDWE